MSKKNPNTIFVLGAGLPRTGIQKYLQQWSSETLTAFCHLFSGTTSTRVALKTLLHGDVYHMIVVAAVAAERPEHRPLWIQAINKTITKQGWETLLEDYVGGVDYPVSFFYKEILQVYPDAKVVLTVRDPVKWYHSVRESILFVR